VRGIASRSFIKGMVGFFVVSLLNRRVIVVLLVSS